jgi:hypothetical protein
MMFTLEKDNFKHTFQIYKHILESFTNQIQFIYFGSFNDYILNVVIHIKFISQLVALLLMFANILVLNEAYYMGLLVFYLGDPAGARNKPGSGYVYGLGIRVDSPLGPLRLEYAFNDKNERRFHFGVGYRN